jgi:hypothetical protein
MIILRYSDGAIGLTGWGVFYMTILLVICACRSAR